MTATQERVTQAIFQAIDAINQGRAPSQRVAKSLDAVLMGAGAILDSMGLVNLIVAVEEEIAEALGVAINIADEQARSQPNSPFRTVRSLADYISALVVEKVNG